MSDFIEGLLGNPLVNFGTGLLAASGPSLQPVGFGQALAQAGQYTSQRQQQQLRLQAARDQIEQRRNQTQAREQLPGLLNTSNVPASIRAPQGLLDQRTMETLSTAYPEAYGQAMVGGLLGQPETPRLSTGLNDFQAINGRLPNSVDEFTQFQAAQDPSAALQAQLTALQIQNEQSEIAQGEESRRVERLTLQRDTNNDLKSLRKLYEMNQKLKPTFLATGGVMPEARRDLMSLFAEGGKLFGVDTSEQEQIIDAYDTFKKEQENLANRVAERYGSNTNARYQGVVNSIPNLGLNPAANESVIARMIEDFLGGADDYGFNVDGRDEYLSLLSPAPEQTAPAPAPAGRIIDWSELP